MSRILKLLKRMSDGRYYRNLGYLESGAQPKFYLGRNDSDAVLRNAQIQRLWEYQRDICNDLEEPLVWSEWTLTIAKAVADGKRECAVRLSSSGTIAVEILADLQDAVPTMRLTLLDQEQQERSQRQLRQRGIELIEEGKAMIVREGNQRLHESITAYVESVEAEYRLTNGSVSDWGQTKSRQISFCRERLPDMRLCDLDMEEIEKCLLLIAKRPNSRKTGLPISRTFAGAAIKEFRKFLRWLHKSKVWQWQKPGDYEVLPIKLHRTPDEKASMSGLQVATYDLEELTVLWTYATPWERCLMVLALNCGLQMAEIGTLRRDEVFLNQKHPNASKFSLASDDRDCWIRRIRHKTLVYGEWRLWGVTVAAIEWLIDNRPQTTSPCLVVNKAGGELKTEGQRNNQIANAWQRVTKRVRRDEPEFPVLSFGKLRKTAANLIRIEASEEIASLFLSHGEALHDKLIVNYANPRYAALHATIWKVGKDLQQVFGSVDEPFPVGEKLGSANISLAVIQQIRDLWKAGTKTGEIAEKLNVSTNTVRRWRDG